MNAYLTKEFVYTLSKESYGIVPGVVKEMAELSVPLAYMYLLGTKTTGQSSLSKLEINAIELKIAMLNKCESCMKGYTLLVKKAGLSDGDVQAIVHQNETSMERLNKLLKAAEYIYYSSNDIDPALVLDYFQDENVTKQQLFEIIELISLKMTSNYVNIYHASIKRKQKVALSMHDNLKSLRNFITS